MVADASPDADRGTVASVIETIHVLFGPHHVVVRSAAPAVSDDLRRAFGPMLADGPAGIEAGSIDVAPAAHGVCVRTRAVEASARVVDSDWAPREVYHEAIKLLMRVRTDLVWIHAGVAAWQNRAMLFVGPSGQGKSTLVAALLERGWNYLSDEFGAIDAAAGCAHPFPLTPRRRVYNGDFLPPGDLAAIRRLPKVDVKFTRHAIGPRPLPVTRICFLRFEPTSSAVCEQPATPAESVIDLLRNSLALEPDRKREILRLVQLVSRVPTVHISYPNVEAAAARVHADAASGPTAA